jgi:membrane associated rhomboid family serine protease
VVIPIHDANPVRRVPVVTYLLILLNVGVFLTEPVSGLTGSGVPRAASVCDQQAYFQRYAAVPKELVHNRQLTGEVPTGEVGTDTLGRTGCIVDRPDYKKTPALSVLFAMFLHGGWLHLLGNMLFLFVFGNNVEDRLGRLRYLLFYLACGYVAAYSFAAFYAGSEETLVGASGAIAGVLGAYLVMFPRARVLSLVPIIFFIPLRLPAWLVLGSWFLLQYVYFRGTGVGGGAGVAYLAHVAGFLTGMVGAFLLRGRASPPPPPAYYGYRYG